MSDSTTTATASSAVETPVDAGSPSTSTERAAAEGGGTDQSSSSWGKDGSVNDYSRFEKLDDPAEEDPLAESVRSKDRGNSAFKEQKFEEAITHYTEAISDLPPKRDDKKNDAARSLRVTLYCNRAACHLKLSNLESCVKDASSAVGSDSKAPKALFRRAQAYEKMGKMEDACRDLYALMRQEPSNKPGKKAYQRVKKQVHSRSLQAIVDAYNTAKAKEEKDAREKEEKARREAAKKKAKAAGGSSAKSSASPAAVKRKPDALSSVDKLDAHEDEEKTLQEVKKKGYCYFNTKMDAATKALYKDTTPRKITAAEAEGKGPVPLATQPRKLTRSSTGSTGSSSFSEWNKAGTTWEEQDVSSRVQKELPAFLVGTGDEATGGTITKVPKCDGTASVACVRAKMRFFFELNIDVNYSIGPLADGSTMASGTLSYPSMTALDMDDPDELFEVQVKYDAGLTAAQRTEVKGLLKNGLQASMEVRIKEFANQFLASF